MNILSLFDGMSCGQIALNRIGITDYTYYASEIDKYAIKVTQSNYPNTIQLGDIANIKASNLPKIDLIIGGSPCQGFSFAGKQLNFNDPRSKLFFEYVRLVKECNPKYFLLENVLMKKEYQDVISKYLGVEPTFINSSLVSAQNRKRLYWTNIPNINLPEDIKINLADIIEDGCVDRHKSHCLDANYYKGGNLKAYFEKHRRQLIFTDESLLAGRIVGRRLKNGIRADSDKSIPIVQQIEVNELPYKTNCLTTVQKDNIVIKVDKGYRNLLPVECERLQTVPDNYTAHVSNSQRYKMLGNGWTVDVICHIFKNLK